jgi:hypothetical protein
VHIAFWGAAVLQTNAVDAFPVVAYFIERVHDPATTIPIQPIPIQPPVPGRPYLIMHIGPSKTGTTTLQLDSVNLGNVLKADRYVYLGRYQEPRTRIAANIPYLFRNDECLEQITDYFATSNTNAKATDVLCWKERVQGIQRYQKSNISIVLSDEIYSYQNKISKVCRNESSYYATLRRAYQQEEDGWNWIVVATYRRYAEWLVSNAKEQNDKHCLHEDAKWMEEGNGKPCHKVWPLVDRWHQRPTATGNGYVNLDVTVPLWQRHGIPIRILNLHDAPPRDDITTSFYCDMVPHAPHACQYSQHRPAPSRHNSKSVLEAAYNDIVWAAAKVGLFDVTRTTRYEATQALRQFGTLHGIAEMTDLPLACPTPRLLDSLLNKSLALERVLLPDFFQSPLGESQHRASFWRLATERKEFCWVATDQLLRGKTTWNQFLEALTSKSWT